jgi:hypothetical protein
MPVLSSQGTAGAVRVGVKLPVGPRETLWVQPDTPVLAILQFVSAKMQLPLSALAVKTQGPPVQVFGKEDMRTVAEAGITGFLLIVEQVTK